jgi:hypothetical protein
MLYSMGLALISRAVNKSRPTQMSQGMWSDENKKANGCEGLLLLVAPILVADVVVIAEAGTARPVPSSLEAFQRSLGPTFARRML